MLERQHLRSAKVASAYIQGSRRRHLGVPGTTSASPSVVRWAGGGGSVGLATRGNRDTQAALIAQADEGRRESGNPP